MLLLASICLWSFPAHSGDRNREHARKSDRHFGAARSFAPREFRHGISLEEAVSRIRKRTGGRVLSAQERDSEYRVRLLTPDGVVRRLRIDPDTGDILR
ncbi:PepSY domain-containing protein [Thiolapillus sp.]